MMNEFEPPERYTSYHSDKTFSILDRSLQNVKNKQGFEFEYNGLQYSAGSRSFDLDDKWRLISIGPMYEYLMPWSKGDYGKPVVAEFDRDGFDEFIETFEIEGKTVRWILKHQKEWKYKLTAEHFEKTLTGFSFCFIYRKIPCDITHADMMPIKNANRGRYLRVVTGVPFDPSQYAPTIPGAEHWFDVFFRTSDCTIPYVWMGPYATVGELLDKTGFDGKTLREIFDTEYDDGEVCCGMFTG